MKNAEMIRRLTSIKASILETCDETLFMTNDPGSTVCDELDGLLSSLGVDDETLESHYEDFTFSPKARRETRNLAMENLIAKEREVAETLQLWEHGAKKGGA